MQFFLGEADRMRGRSLDSSRIEVGQGLVVVFVTFILCPVLKSYGNGVFVAEFPLFSGNISYIPCRTFWSSFPP